MGSWQDHDRAIRNYNYRKKQTDERMAKRLSKLPPIGAIDSESGKPVVGYRSNEGRLGKYLLLAERKVIYYGQEIFYCDLGFFGGKAMPDGKRSFEVKGDRVLRTQEEADDAQKTVGDDNRGGKDQGAGGNQAPEAGGLTAE